MGKTPISSADQPMLPFFGDEKPREPSPEVPQPAEEAAKEPEHAKPNDDWRRMRKYVIPRQLLKPLNEAEAAIASLPDLFSLKPKSKLNHVNQLLPAAGPDDTRLAFEAVIAKAEILCRQARKERGSSFEDYERPALQPQLDKLASATPDDRIRSMTSSPQTARYMARVKQVGVLRDVVRNYAEELGAKFSGDKLWNAYRLDFNGRKGEEFTSHPFIQQFPRTAEIMRKLARARTMERLLRKLDGTQEGIITAAKNFMDHLPEQEPLHMSTVGRDLAYLASAMPSLSEHEDEEFSKRLDSAISGLKTIADGERNYPKLRFKVELREAYQADAKALMKRASKRGDDPFEVLSEALTTAKHIEPIISHLRAEVVLNQLADFIDKEKLKIERIYPDSHRSTNRTVPRGYKG